MVELSSTVNETDPLPLPVPPLVIVIQVSLLDDDHSQPSGELRPKLPFPPSKPMGTELGDSA